MGSSLRQDLLDHICNLCTCDTCGINLQNPYCRSYRTWYKFRRCTCHTSFTWYKFLGGSLRQDLLDHICNLCTCDTCGINLQNPYCRSYRTWYKFLGSSLRQDLLDHICTFSTYGTCGTYLQN